MSSDDVRKKAPQRYHQRIRLVAVLVSGVFTLPMLFVFGVTLRELSSPPEPSIYAVPQVAPEPSVDAAPQVAPESSIDAVSQVAPESSIDAVSQTDTTSTTVLTEDPSPSNRPSLNSFPPPLPDLIPPGVPPGVPPL